MCRPGKGTWTPKEKENQAAFIKNPVTRGKVEACKRIMGLRRVMSRLEKNRRLPGKEAEQLKTQRT